MSQYADGEQINGAILLIDSTHVLVGGQLPANLPHITLYRGPITIRYALPFVYEPDSFFVQRIVDDFGRDFRGKDALDFAYRTGDAFPRAAVIGMRASSGAEEQIFLKQLDLARSMVPVAYKHSEGSELIAQIDAAVWLHRETEGFRPIQRADNPFGMTLFEAVSCYYLSPQQVRLLPQLLSSE